MAKSTTTYTYASVLQRATQYFDGEATVAEIWSRHYALRTPSPLVSTSPAAVDTWFTATPDDNFAYLAHGWSTATESLPLAHRLQASSIFPLLQDFRYLIPSDSLLRDDITCEMSSDTSLYAQCAQLSPTGVGHAVPPPYPTSSHTLSLNLLNYITAPHTAKATLDEALLSQHAALALRILDSVVTQEITAIQHHLTALGKTLATSSYPRHTYYQYQQRQQRLALLQAQRPVGVNVVELSEAVAALGISEQEKALAITNHIMRTIATAVYTASVKLAQVQGASEQPPHSSPAKYPSVYDQPRRNAVCLTLVPLSPAQRLLLGYAQRQERLPISTPTALQHIALGVAASAWIDGPCTLPIHTDTPLSTLLTPSQADPSTSLYYTKARVGTAPQILSQSANKLSLPPDVTEHRPDVLSCDVVRFQNNKEKWVALVGLLDGRPYEIFTGLQDDDEGIVLPKSVTSGRIIRHLDEEGNKRYDFQFENKRGYKTTVEGLSEKFNKEYWNYAKLISGVLRYRMPVAHVIKLVASLQLGSDNINTWKVGVERALKKYVGDESLSDEPTPPHNP